MLRLKSRWHDLRHTFASGPAQAKSSQLDGTKSLRTRRRYAHLGPEGASRRQWRCWTKNLLAQAFSTGELRFPNYLSSKSLGA